MADADKSKAEQAARRVAGWLARNEESFKRDGVEEGALASALGMSGDDVTAGVDYLENREDVVRIPHILEKPPRVVLKPGRAWHGLRDEILGKESGG